MSVYGVQEFLYKVDLDQSLLDLTKSNPKQALEGFDLTVEERRLLIDGEIGRLYDMGVHAFLLAATVRHGLFEMDREKYEKKIKKL